MCGIVGFAGLDEAAPILLEGLRRLEYRGYDSAGIVVCDNGKLKLTKAKGYVQNLSELTDGGKLLRGLVGLGHTRWATHGQPSDENAHPHISDGGKIAVVHNGIIENYSKLREKLISKGFHFMSETDTEVAVNLIQYYYNKHGDILKAVSTAASRMEGSYALGILCEDDPDTIIATKRESPLIIGSGKTGNHLASDVSALLQYTRDVYRMDDGETAVLKTDSIKFYNNDMEEISKELIHIDWDVSAAEKGGYEHFMIKEIMEQPEVIRKTVSPRVKDGRVVFDELKITPEFIRNIDRIYVVACGSAYHVGILAKYNIEKLVKKPVEAILASEFRYSSPVVSSATLVICISQSGTTADTIAALREAKRLGAHVLSIVNVMGSTIATESDDVIYTLAGPEIAVATTKAYSAQLVLTYLIALHFADICGTIEKQEYDKLLASVLEIPEKIEKILDGKEHIQYLASRYFNNGDIFFIGRNTDYALSLEASLKLKEIAYIHSDAYAAGELKHGTLALVEDGTLVICIAACLRLIEKTFSNAIEAKSRGARLLTLTTESGAALAKTVSDEMIVIPDAQEALLPSLAIVPMQLFAYYVALQRGCSIDKPRNLAKSSTVE